MRWRYYLASIYVCMATTVLAQTVGTEQQIQQLIDQKKYDQAITSINDQLKNKPRNANLRFMKGVAFTQQGNTSEAIETFTALTQEFPELAHPYNNLAVLYMQQNDYQKARVALETAIRLNPTYTLALENLGDVYAILALQQYQLSQQLNPNNASIKQKLSSLNGLSLSRVSQPTDQNSPMVQEVVQTLNAWAQAWSNRDAVAYLKFYADNFVLPKNLDRNAWQLDRKQKLEDKKEIKVSLQTISIELQGNIAIARFTQIYHSDKIDNTSQKTMKLKKIANTWLIIEERAGI